MKPADVVIIGGSAAGITAAITSRRHYPDKKVLLVRKEQQVQIPCGIPYIFGTVGTPDNNLTPDGVLTNNGIDLLIDEVKSIDREKRQLSTSGGETIGYDRLIIATGSSPIELPIPGLKKENVYTVRKDTEYLRELSRKMDGAKDIVILGGGFIGVEFADECKKNRDVNVTIIEMLPQCLMLAFEEDLCTEATEALKARGINILTNTKLEEVQGDKKVSGVKLSNGSTLKADILMVCIGSRSNVELAKDAGLGVNRGGIVVDSHMRTSDENIFACGDCTEKHSFFTGKQSPLMLASIATMESRIAGANLFGTSRDNPGTLGVFSTAIGNLTLAVAGLTEKVAKESGFDVVCGQAEAPNRHPGGMPGMAKMKVKLTFNKKTGEIIGGQVRGGPSTGELINAISACIQKRMTANEIAMFQIGTHPAVTASPITCPMVNAAEVAIMNMKKC